MTSGVFLVSGLLLQLLDDHSALPLERSVAQLTLRGGASTEDFHVVIPAPVLDIVDIEKTDAKIARDEVVPGAGKFVTLAKFPNGFVFRDSAPIAILGKYDVKWWWRECLVHAASKPACVVCALFTRTTPLMRRKSTFIWCSRRRMRRAEDWPWSSVRAHLSGRDDALVRTAPLAQHVRQDMSRFFEADVTQDAMKKLRAASVTGAPAGWCGMAEAGGARCGLA